METDTFPKRFIGQKTLKTRCPVLGLKCPSFQADLVSVPETNAPQFGHIVPLFKEIWFLRFRKALTNKVVVRASGLTS